MPRLGKARTGPSEGGGRVITLQRSGSLTGQTLHMPRTRVASATRERGVSALAWFVSMGLVAPAQRSCKANAPPVGGTRTEGALQRTPALASSAANFVLRKRRSLPVTENGKWVDACRPRPPNVRKRRIVRTNNATRTRD